MVKSSNKSSARGRRRAGKCIRGSLLGHKQAAVNFCFQDIQEYQFVHPRIFSDAPAPALRLRSNSQVTWNVHKGRLWHEKSWNNHWSRCRLQPAWFDLHCIRLESIEQKRNKNYFERYCHRLGISSFCQHSVLRPQSKKRSHQRWKSSACRFRNC